jgi:hypothetical protein
MIRIVFLTYYHFYILDLLYKIFPGSFGKKRSIIFDTLNNNISYALQADAKKDILVVLRQYKRLIAESFKKVEFKKPDSKIAIFDSLTRFFETRSAYLHACGVNGDFHDLAKDNVMALAPVPFKLLLILVMTISLPFIFLTNIFKKDKSKNGIKVTQFGECAALLHYCNKNGIKKVFYFTIFEPDSNICSYLLDKTGVECGFITSEVPLRFGNMKMVANEINFCFGYQLDEYEIYKKDIIAEKLNLFMPETVHETASFYTKENNFSTPPNTIGFISSGMWLRKVLGDMDSGLNELENENKILSWLLEYVSQNPDKTLIIYLHPLEKNKIHLEMTMDHYKMLFKNGKPNFAPFDIPSARSFNNADVAVALYSTLIYERIFMGFKSIITPLEIQDFPVENSSLHKSSAKSKEELFDKLTLFLKFTPQEYIEHIGFEKRYYKNFPQLL